MTIRGALVVITPDITKTFPNQFKRLNFANTNVRNGCCYWLSKSYQSLRALDISNCDDVSDAGIIELTRGCKRLQHLTCPGLSKITTIGAKAILMHLPKLKHVNLSNARRLNDHPFIVSADENLKLESYILSNMPLMTDESLNVLSRICTLTEITIDIYPLDGKHSHVTDKMQRLLGKFCKGLAKVVYTGALWLTDPGLLSLIANCKELKEICIGMVPKTYRAYPVLRICNEVRQTKFC